jgi:hypothetical protein
VAFGSALALAPGGRRVGRLAGAYVAFRGLEILVAATKAGRAADAPAAVASSIAMFGVDVAASVAALALRSRRRAPDWLPAR